MARTKSIGASLVASLFIAGTAPSVEAITLPDNSSCNTTATNGCLRINNTNTGSAARALTGAASGSGTGVTGTSSSGPGVSGTSTNGNGVTGTTASASTTAAGVLGVATGLGSFGVIGRQKGNDSGTGVLGEVTDAAGNPANNGFAVRGFNGGISIYGQNSVGGTGVVGDSQSNIGVMGISRAIAADKAGVLGTIDSTADASCGGVMGDAQNSGSTWAGKFIGDVEARGFYNSSDARLKKDIKDADYGLPELMSLRPVSYQWKDGGDHARHNGLIAQEVQKVFPASVRAGGKGGGTLTVDYVSLLPVAIKAIQQQEEIIRRQEARIAELERRNAPRVSSGFWGGTGALATFAVLPVGLFFARRRRNRADS